MVWPKKKVRFFINRASLMKAPSERYSAKNSTINTAAAIRQVIIPTRVIMLISIKGGVSVFGFFVKCCQANACVIEYFLRICVIRLRLQMSHPTARTVRAIRNRGVAHSAHMIFRGKGYRKVQAA